MELHKEEDSYCIDCYMGEQGSWGIKKLAIGTRTDSNGNDLGTSNETTKQIYGADIPQRRPQQP